MLRGVHEKARSRNENQPLPTDLPPGEYTPLVGVYNWRDGSRLTPENGQADDLYPFTTVQVKTDKASHFPYFYRNFET